MFRTSWFYPQRDSFVYSMVLCTCVDVNVHTDACETHHTAYTTV